VSDTLSDPRPLLPFLSIPGDGSPFLTGLRCSSCGATFTDARSHCAGCGSRDGLQSVRLGPTGRLYAFTVVHRSFPEVKVPYVSAVVDLDGGGVLKGNLVGVSPDSESIRVGMAVELYFDVADQLDEEGQSYLAYFFRPGKTES